MSASIAIAQQTAGAGTRQPTLEHHASPMDRCAIHHKVKTNVRMRLLVGTSVISLGSETLTDKIFIEAYLPPIG